jgi:DNA repair protein RadD
VRTEQPRPFERCIFEVSLKELVAQRFLVPPILEDAPIAQYDFSALSKAPRWDEEPHTVNQLLVRHPSVTQAIIEQVVQRAEAGRRRGVMIFAATVAHARAIAGYLPSAECGLVLGDTESSERDQAVRDFKAGHLRYLVNVSVLTTGFDAPHVDMIAILRPTQSVSLFQQIVGRGLRLFPGKADCLVIDYAGNGFDLYSPEVGGERPTSDSQVVSVQCPSCEFENQFWGQVDADGRVIEHFGRRCQRWIQPEGGPGRRCDYRFRFKECERCNAENDIAARRCHACDVALVDPDDQLRDALRLTDARVLRIAQVDFAAEGSHLRVTYHDEDGHSEHEQFDFEHPGQRAAFNAVFGRRLASGRRPLQFERADQAARLSGLLPRPDFVVLRKHKFKGRRGAYFRVELRVFDYQGRFRKAAV